MSSRSASGAPLHLQLLREASALRVGRELPGPLERLSEGIALAGYGLAAVGLAAAFFVLFGGDPRPTPSTSPSSR